MSSFEVSCTQLPSSTLGHNNIFGVWYDSQYDMHLESWHGEPVHELKNLPKNRISTGLSHSSEPVIVAALIGFMRRAQTPQEEITRMFMPAYGQLDAPRPSYQKPYHNHELLAEGESATAFDISDFGWSALAVPIPAQPGLLESYGGTGFYTEGEGEHSKLVLAPIAPRSSTPASADQAIRLRAPDVQPVASLMCRIAVGEPAKDIAHMLRIEFPSLSRQ